MQVPFRDLRITGFYIYISDIPVHHFTSQGHNYFKSINIYGDSDANKTPSSLLVMHFLNKDSTPAMEHCTKHKLYSKSFDPSDLDFLGPPGIST
jgi:hypothetical protein